MNRYTKEVSDWCAHHVELPQNAPYMDFLLVLVSFEVTTMGSQE